MIQKLIEGEIYKIGDKESPTYFRLVQKEETIEGIMYTIKILYSKNNVCGTIHLLERQMPTGVRLSNMGEITLEMLEDGG